MATFLIYLNLPKYLAQWLVSEHYSKEKGAVVFPRGSNERNILELFLTKLPKGAVPDTPKEGSVPVEIPAFAYKPPATYHYLPARGRDALVSAIKIRFKKMMWEELHQIRPAEVKITDLVYAFLEKHGIEPDEKNWETVRQMYFRMRKVYGNK